MSSNSATADVQTSNFGFTSDTNEPVALYTLTNSRSAQVELIPFGASLRSLRLPAKDDRLIDAVLGFEKLQGYEKNDAYLGCIVGRVCSRIKAGQFTIDGQTYQLAINNGPNHLHGGKKGFCHRVWKTKEVGPDFVTFEYLSVDGEEGYPSTVRVSVTYRLPSNANRLIIEFKAANEGAKTTPVSLTSHSYFNLGGVNRPNPSIRDHQLTVFSDSYLPTDADHLVTGEVRPVNGTLYDFRTPALLGDRLGQLSPELGYDAHFCNTVTSTPKPLAVLSCPQTGLSISVSSTQPGLQIYTAQYMNETGGKYGQSYGKYSGIAMEAQHYPDAVNKLHFPPIWLGPGEKDHQVTVIDFEGRSACDDFWR